MHLFYTKEIYNKVAFLSENESKHAIKVLRLREGQAIELVDGKGGYYKGIIAEANPKKCNVDIIESQQEYGKREQWIHIAIAPTKSMDRFEWFLEKATEIGVDEITPFIGFHSERKVLKYDRLERVVLAAIKQSQKAYLPKINPMLTFTELITKSDDSQKYIAICSKTEKPLLSEIESDCKKHTIIIGPEGDFSEIEKQEAVERGFLPVSLGDSRLRTETAGLIACHLLNLK